MSSLSAERYAAFMIKVAVLPLKEDNQRRAAFYRQHGVAVASDFSFKRPLMLDWAGATEPTTIQSALTFAGDE